MADILGNLVLLGTNEDAGLWDYGSTASQDGFSAFSLGVPGYLSSWRSDLTDTPILYIDRGPGQPAMAGILLAGGNLRPGVDQVKITVSGNSDFTDPDYASADWELALDDSALGSRPRYPSAGIAFGWVFPQALANQYIRVEFDISGHPDGYVEVCAVTGSGYWPMITRAEDASFDRQGEEEQVILSGPPRSGFAVLEQRFPFRAMLPAALRDLQGVTSNLLRHDGRIGWVVGSLFDRSTHAPRLGYGVVKEPLLTINPAGAGALYRSTTLALVESSE